MHPHAPTRTMVMPSNPQLFAASLDALLHVSARAEEAAPKGRSEMREGPLIDELASQQVIPSPAVIAEWLGESPGRTRMYYMKGYDVNDVRFSGCASAASCVQSYYNPSSYSASSF